MAREKEHFRDVLADIVAFTNGKRVLGVNDIQKYLRVGRSKALVYLDGEKNITVHKFASKLL